MVKRANSFAVRNPDALITACCRGDAGAWDEFIASYNRAVVCYVVRACRQLSYRSSDGMDPTADLVQDVYLRLVGDECRILRAWRGKTVQSLLSYLAKVALTVVWDTKRRSLSLKRKVTLVSLDSEGEDGAPPLAEHLPAADRSLPDHMYEERDAYEQLRGRLAALGSGPLQARNSLIFLLHTIEGLSASEIARLPGIAMEVASVESVIRRTRERLREARDDFDDLTG